MTIRHHISDSLLADYATGELAEGWSLAVATHLSLCPSCRKRLAKFEAAAGEMLEELVPRAENLDVAWADMQKLIGNAQAASPKSTHVPAADKTPPVLPEPLRSYVGTDAAGLNWKALGRGAFHVPIKTDDGKTSVRLLRIPAGKPVPEHSHGGRELTLVLAGSFSDINGRFARGDLEDADETIEHQPFAGPEEDCICLAVTDAPLRFKSRLMKLVQPFIGI